MLTPTGTHRVWVATSPVDMRRGFDGLVALVEQDGMSVYSGDLYVFLSRRRDLGGLALFHKRLEKDRFVPPPASPGAAHQVLDHVQLAMLLDGVDLRQVRRLQAWEPSGRT